MTTLIIVLAVALVGVVTYAIRVLNGGFEHLGTRGGRGGRLTPQQIKIRDGLAARQALEELSDPDVSPFDPSVQRPLGLIFAEAGNADLDGVEVIGVAAGSPAARVGLQVGARLTSVGGVAVEDSDAAEAATRRHSPGLPLSLVWVFSNQESRASVIL